MFYAIYRQLALVLVPVYFINHSVSCYIYYIFVPSLRTDHYWSGYYTSRPYHKNMDRVLQAHLRAAEVIYSVVVSHDLPVDGQLSGVPSLLTDARRHLGLFQHHDGITGTAKDHVVVDYAKKCVQFL